MKHYTDMMFNCFLKLSKKNRPLYYATPILLSLVILAQPSWADKSATEIHFFRVTLYNNMPFNCDLQDSSIFYGQLVAGTPIPVYLAPGSTNQFLVQEGTNTGANVRLTYACEGGRQITFLSRSYLNFRRRDNNIRHTVLNSVSMKAYVNRTEQSYLRNISDIGWVFSQS